MGKRYIGYESIRDWGEVQSGSWDSRVNGAMEERRTTIAQSVKMSHNDILYFDIDFQILILKIV